MWLIGFCKECVPHDVIGYKFNSRPVKLLISTNLCFMYDILAVSNVMNKRRRKFVLLIKSYGFGRSTLVATAKPKTIIRQKSC